MSGRRRGEGQPSVADLHGRLQNGELTREQIRVAALVGFKPAQEVWRDLSRETPSAAYVDWDPRKPLGVNLSHTNDFGLIGVAVLGVTREVLQRAAPRDRRIRAGFSALERWVVRPSAAAAHAAREAIFALAPKGRAPKHPAARVLVTSLAWPALASRVDRANNVSWSDYVREHPEAAGGTKRAWIQRLEHEARGGLIAVCREAGAVLPPQELDLALRRSVTSWALPPA